MLLIAQITAGCSIENSIMFGKIRFLRQPKFTKPLKI